MSPKIKKILGEIQKAREKISDYQNRLKELERTKTELENADIVALVRAIDIPPSELEAFVKTYKKHGAYPAPEGPAPAGKGVTKTVTPQEAGPGSGLGATSDETVKYYEGGMPNEAELSGGEGASDEGDIEFEEEQ